MKNSKIVIIMMILGLIFSIYFLSADSKSQKELIEINTATSVKMKIKVAYNERGIYILNDKFFVRSDTHILGNDYSISKDKAIWRPTNKKYIPSISDISAPFEIYKNKNSDTLTLIKGNKKIILLLE
ncbi:hypothetical protein [Flavobacterium sp. YJ01]|uniref:hypothetical protein n=1 Tax=unclassified Flavobacterium TaxID=196869 RepID=UPI0023E43305|nr:hypothetical protein [Flavobacterium sp. YJ01]WET04367.1 hypothetical protein P0R33_08525 [Flavobacterium sp. YJ01]